MASREHWTEYFQNRGARVSNSTTKQTTIVIVGEEPGASKIAKAQHYGVGTISWPMFVYLGFTEERSTYQLTTLPEDVLQDIIYAIALTCERLYAYAIRSGSDHAYESFIATSSGLRRLLFIGWGSEPTNLEGRN